MNAPTLLLIEDDLDYVDLIERAMRRAGLILEVRVAYDGLEALVALGLEGDGGGSPGALPRVVFLDLNMPRVDGWEVLRRMRASARTARLPVVVLSSSDRPEDIRRSYALGANSYLLKRLEPRGSGAQLADAARYWTEMNQVTHDAEPSVC